MFSPRVDRQILIDVFRTVIQYEKVTSAHAPDCVVPGNFPVSVKVGTLRHRNSSCFNFTVNRHVQIKYFGQQREYVNESTLELTHSLPLNPSYL